MQLQIECNESAPMHQRCMLCNQRFELKQARVIVYNNSENSCGELCPQCISMGPDQLWKGIEATQQQGERESHCTLKWRQNKLLVRREEHLKQPYLPTLENQQSLVDCLKHSDVQIVSLTTELGAAKLQFWADACAIAGLPAFLQLPSMPDLPQKKGGICWQIKRLLDKITAAVLLLILSPLLLGLAALIRIQSHGPILFRQWRVGERGKLFKICKFRTMVVGAESLHHQVMEPSLYQHEDDPCLTPLGQWLHKYGLDELPQLYNVLRGEMSLVGPRPWALDDAVRIQPDMQKRLNALPGIISFWQVKARSKLLSIDAVNRCDLRYLRQWSLWQDLQILLLIVPKVLSVGANYSHQPSE